jgi:hypothetical protein
MARSQGRASLRKERKMLIDGWTVLFYLLVMISLLFGYGVAMSWRDRIRKEKIVDWAIRNNVPKAVLDGKVVFERTQDETEGK